MEKLDAAIAIVGPEQARSDEVRDPEADGASDQGAKHARDGCLAETAFEQNDKARQHEPEYDVNEDSDRKRLKQRGSIGHHDDEHDPTETKPGHWGYPRMNCGRLDEEARKEPRQKPRGKHITNCHEAR
ncbi:MAG TPA: hypothetical protein VFI56_14150 [Vicinamibacterales bacterium]|nr:hypothetical protein [Vicinamibacterales bacterium]